MKLIKATIAGTILFGAALSDPVAWTAEGKDMKGMDMSAPASSAGPQGTGVVKSVDVAGGKVTLSHDPIKAINWPAMTMGFKVADPKLLDGLASGKKVQFTMKSQEDSTITAIKVLP
ncbi:MAG: copper-binding protein [Pseudomonadota bacterium]